MLKFILMLPVALQSYSAANLKIETETAKLNRKFAEHMKLVEQFAKDSRKMHKDLLKQRNLTKADKENIKKMEKENQKLLEQVQENIWKLEAQD